MKRLEGDKAVYYKHDEAGKLHGMVSTHVDDFTLAGKDDFIEHIMKEISKALDVSKVEDGMFRFTGIDVKQTENGVVLSMEDYAQSLEEIQIREDRSDEVLSREEMKLLRKYVGKLNRLAANMRPDLSFYALDLAKKQKAATLKDLRSINQILKKVKEK